MFRRDALILATAGKDGNRLHQILSGGGVGLGGCGGLEDQGGVVVEGVSQKYAVTKVCVLHMTCTSGANGN